MDKKIKWKLYQGALIPDVAPHIEINLASEDIKQLLKKYKPYFIRWTTDFDLPYETDFWYVIKDKPMELADFSKKRRSEIKRGLKYSVVKKITKKELINLGGYQVYKSAFTRYKTFLKPIEEKQFNDQILGLSDEWEFWGVFMNETLIAYSQNRIYDGICNYSTIKFNPDFLKYYPSYALFFVMDNHYLKERNLKYILDGARNISHQTNIQDFLIRKFKFRKAFCKLHVVYRTDIKIAVNLLYPFRKVLEKIQHPTLQKINVLLKQEEIRRTF